MFVLAKDKGKGIKHLVGPKPDIPGLAQFHARLEVSFVCFTDKAIDSISGNQQVIPLPIPLSHRYIGSARHTLPTPSPYAPLRIVKFRKIVDLFIEYQ